MVFNKYRDEVPDEAINIMRPSKWGNPFKLGPETDRETVLLKYTEWLLSQPALVEQVKKELRGKNLVCCCAPKLCHGHVLELIANEL